MKEKLEAFEVFKKFKVMMEKTTNLYIKALRSDRGGEYMSAAFINYCEEQVIKRFFTAPYSPKQNGVVKRKNRTILDMVRSMLKSKDMLKEFWAEVVQYAVYVQNRYPHSKLENKHHKKLEAAINQLYHTFKCLVVWPTHIYDIPDQRRTKLDNKNKKYVFVGYDEKTKAFKLFDPIDK